MKSWTRILLVVVVALGSFFCGPAIADNLRFAPVDGNGNIVPSLGSSDCVVDHASGLIWQSKSSPRLLVSIGVGANPQSTDASVGPAKESTADDYIKTVNEVSQCGSQRWRLPTVGELSSLVDRNSKNEALINTGFYVDVRATTYLTSSGYDDGRKIWVVNFAKGITQVTDPTIPHFVLLVHN